METNERWVKRFQNFEKALFVFQARCNDVLENPASSRYYETCRMALIQAFEIVIELSWKTLKDYLESQGYIELQSGKKTFRQAFQAGVIGTGELWLKALDIRNLTSHTYDMSQLDGTIDFLLSELLPELQTLKTTLQKEMTK